MVGAGEPVLSASKCSREVMLKEIALLQQRNPSAGEMVSFTFLTPCTAYTAEELEDVMEKGPVSTSES